MKAFTDTVAAFKLVWIRIACYFIIPFFTTFLALTETWSEKTWQETGNFLISRLFISCFVSGITSLVAYIDSTYQRAKQDAAERKEKRDIETNFTKQAELASKMPENG